MELLSALGKSSCSKAGTPPTPNSTKLSSCFFPPTKGCKSLKPQKHDRIWDQCIPPFSLLTSIHAGVQAAWHIETNPGVSGTF